MSRVNNGCRLAAHNRFLINSMAEKLSPMAYRILDMPHGCAEISRKMTSVYISQKSLAQIRQVPRKTDFFN